MKISHHIIVLWMSGLTWNIADQIPAIARLRTCGATVIALEPLPITGQQSQSLQVLSGQNPGYTGYFDSWTLRQYRAQPSTEHTAHLLPEILALHGYVGTQVNLPLAEVPAYLNTSDASIDYLIVRTVASNDRSMVDRAITAAQQWSGTDETCVLLSDHQPAAVKYYVNLNDGLRSSGILETSELYTIDWKETLAYYVGHGQLWINLAGREKAGIVAPGDEYEQVCQALVTLLPAKLLDPQTGESVIERIYRRDELYIGDYLFQAPDLVVVLRPDYAPSPRSALPGFDGRLTWPAPANTYAVAGLNPTTVTGLMIAAGPAFAVGQTVEHASLLDFVPTFLHALQLPIPTRIDGQVGTTLFTHAFMQQFPLRQVEEDAWLSTEDKAEIILRLKSLGYLE